MADDNNNNTTSRKHELQMALRNILDLFKPNKKLHGHSCYHCSSLLGDVQSCGRRKSDALGVKIYPDLRTASVSIITAFSSIGSIRK